MTARARYGSAAGQPLASFCLPLPLGGAGHLRARHAGDALALPLTALQLGAGPAQMGLLLTVQTAPFLVLSLIAGAWVDRRRRWPVLIWTDLGRGALLLTIPVAAALDRLVLAQLYVVGLLSGVLTLLFGIAYAAYMPRVVGRAALLETNSRIATTDQIARVSGAGLGGAAVQVLTAPVAIAADALTFFISACFLRLGRVEEPSPERPTRRRGFRGEITGGPNFVWRTPAVRAIVVAPLQPRRRRGERTPHPLPQG